MTTIQMYQHAGAFGENKDVARDIRLTHIMPSLELGKEITLDFEGMSGATQSFIHALLSEPIRLYGPELFEMIVFKNCAPVVQEVITIVAEYMLEA